ncbi:MAG: YajQ family cyclic di-GMP-binding protein [Candidatus Hydrogenedentes bacterium]|nr:YajQ family cyclic di-GMP-binding protein [Candidatus Hydrogenedentota bacterium]
MPSFDVVNKTDMQELDNAVNITKKVVDTRYDFRGSQTEISLDKKTTRIAIVTEDTMKMRAIEEILAGNLVKRGVSPKALQYGEVEPTSKGHVKRDVKIIEGIETDLARKIVKMIKDTKLKVQAQIQDQQVRVTGNKIDDLQSVIQMLKAANLDIPLQFVNMKS